MGRPAYWSILDAIPELALLVNAGGQILLANKAAKSAFGRSLAGESLFELVETPRESVAAYLRRCTGSVDALLGTLTYRTRQGRLEARCEGAVLLPNDDLPHSVVLLRCRAKREAVSRFTLLTQKIADLGREILRRQNAEEELRRVNRTLEARVEEGGQHLASVAARLDESEQQLGLFIRGVVDYAIFMLDPQGRVRSWNAGAQRIKGYRAEEITGQHFSTFYTEEDRLNDVPGYALRTAGETGRFESEGWNVRKDGNRFWASVVIFAIRDQAGRLVGFAKVTRDLTERRAAEERLRQAQKMEAIGQLTGGVAHDFNNTLAVISGNIEALQRRLPRNDAAVERNLQQAMRGVERAASLTHRLLAFSRQQPLDPKPTDLNRLIVGMSDLLRRTLSERVSIETVLSAGLWPASADPNEIENAVLNLAVNARDAMPNGGKLTIETANVFLDEAYAAANEDVVSGQYVMLAVSDTGVGIPKEIIGKVFDPFFTTKQLGEGTGLGLSQVHGFAKQSGGHIKIYSEPGEGTTVRLYFPRLSHARPTDDHADEQAIAGSAQPGEVILVVEDDQDVRAATTEMLRELGYAVRAVSEGDAALSVLLTEPAIKLLFTDIGLPGPYSGRGLADEARKHRPDLKVLFTTGYARNAIIHQGRLDPGVNLIVKPFTYTGLAAKIRAVLDEG